MQEQFSGDAQQPLHSVPRLVLTARRTRGLPRWYRGPLAQGGTHTGVTNLKGMAPVKATRKTHYFFYKISLNEITQIRPDPVPVAAPGGILEQIGVDLLPI